VNADNSGKLLTNGVAQAFRDTNDVPWWAEYDVLNLWQSFDADPSVTNPTTEWAGSFGDDYIAGGPQSDLVFGELGNDTIQGDGSIDFVAHLQHDNGDGTSSYATSFPGLTDPLNPLGRVTSYRSAGGCTTDTLGANICTATGALTIYPSKGRPSDGEDYIEGNGGRDLIFGGLGQDDIVGGSSDFFSLLLNDQRPDVADLIFGGSGELTARNDDTGNGATLSSTVNGSSLNQSINGAGDADTILSDNGDIVRIVGVGGIDTTADNCNAANGQVRYGPANCLNNGVKPEDLGPTDRYLSFVYDDSDTAGVNTPGANHPTSKLVVHGTTLLDYTPGGPDFRPDLFNTNLGNCANGSPASRWRSCPGSC